MPDYLVIWRIDIFDAANPQEAAEKARAAQTREGTIATVFDVCDPPEAGGALVATIDLTCPEESEFYRITDEKGELIEGART